MNRIVLIASFLSLPFFAFSQPKKEIITLNSAGNVYIGMSGNKFIKENKKDSLVIIKNICELYRNGKLVLKVIDKNNSKLIAISGIVIFSDQYYLKEGIEVGNNIQEIRKAVPNARICLDQDNGGEYFELNQYQSDSINLTIDMKPSSGKTIGKYNNSKGNENCTGEFENNGKISSISIFKFN